MSNTSPPSSIWIVQQQFYYYSDEYCATAQNPEGWFRTREAAEKFCGEKNLEVIRQYAKDYSRQIRDGSNLSKFLDELSKDEQLATIAQPGFDTESNLGISYDCNLDWYEVVELSLIGE